jgi:hypothetical protein
MTTRRRSARRCLAVLGLSALAPTPARADVGARVDADLELGGPIGFEARSFAVGAGGRLGWRFDLGPLWLQPEVGGSYVAFLGNVDFANHLVTYTGKHVTRVTGGLRLGGAGLIARVLEPALFGHAGYGWADGEYTDLPMRKGPAFDVGLAIDLKLVRHLSLGVQGAYNVVTFPPPPYYLDLDASRSASVQWVSFGVHVGASF